VKVIAEPGRFLVSDAGYSSAHHGDGNPREQALDASGRRALRRHSLRKPKGSSTRSEPTRRTGHSWNVAGPTCDSIDVVMRDEPLPSDLQEGDLFTSRRRRLYHAYASKFKRFRARDPRDLTSGSSSVGGR